MECVSESAWLAWCVHAMARLIFLDVVFALDFAAGPQSHGGAVVPTLSSAQVQGPSGLARVLPRRNGIVQARSGAWVFAVEFLSGHVVVR